MKPGDEVRLKDAAIPRERWHVGEVVKVIDSGPLCGEVRVRWGEGPWRTQCWLPRYLEVVPTMAREKSVTDTGSVRKGKHDNNIRGQADAI
jgi:hypothetical protein